MTAGVLMLWIVRRGRRVTRGLMERLPGEYDALDRPWPGYFNTQRSIRYNRFLFQRQYEALGEPFIALFEEQRRLELRFLAFLVAGFVLLGGAAGWLRWFA